MEFLKNLFTAPLHHFIHKDFHEVVSRMTLIDKFLFLVKYLAPCMHAAFNYFSLLNVNNIDCHSYILLLNFWLLIMYVSCSCLCRLCTPWISWEYYGTGCPCLLVYFIWDLGDTFTRSTTCSTSGKPRQAFGLIRAIIRTLPPMANITIPSMKVPAVKELSLAGMFSLLIKNTRYVHVYPTIILTMIQVQTSRNCFTNFHEQFKAAAYVT